MHAQHIATVAAGLLFASAPAATMGADPEVRFSTGVEFSSGTYGNTETIEDIYVPLTLSVDYDRMAFRLTVPHLTVTGPAGTTITDPGGQPLPGEGEITTESGLGDVIASVTFLDVLHDYERGLALDATASAKFGTADFDEGLGTGKDDYTLQFEAYKFFDSVTLFGSAGYRLRGEPVGVELNDVLIASIGASWFMSERSSFGTALDFRESAVTGFDDVLELSGFVSRRLSDSWVVDVYTFTGFSDSSPDWGVGASLTFGPGR